jgi:hypothetical protein
MPKDVKLRVIRLPTGASMIHEHSTLLAYGAAYPSVMTAPEVLTYADLRQPSCEAIPEVGAVVTELLVAVVVLVVVVVVVVVNCGRAHTRTSSRTGPQNKLTMLVKDTGVLAFDAKKSTVLTTQPMFAALVFATENSKSAKGYDVSRRRRKQKEEIKKKIEKKIETEREKEIEKDIEKER